MDEPLYGEKSGANKVVHGLIGFTVCALAFAALIIGLVYAFKHGWHQHLGLVVLLLVLVAQLAVVFRWYAQDDYNSSEFKWILLSICVVIVVASASLIAYALGINSRCMTSAPPYPCQPSQLANVNGTCFIGPRSCTDATKLCVDYAKHPSGECVACGGTNATVEAITHVVASSLRRDDLSSAEIGELVAYYVSVYRDRAHASPVAASSSSSSSSSSHALPRNVAALFVARPTHADDIWQHDAAADDSTPSSKRAAAGAPTSLSSSVSIL